MGDTSSFLVIDACMSYCCQVSSHVIAEKHRLHNQRTFLLLNNIATYVQIFIDRQKCTNI